MSTVNSSSSQAAITNEINNLQRELKNKDTVQVFKDDTGTRRVLLGKGADGFYGVKVSQEGNDVYDAADENLVFNSDNNLFKIHSVAEATLSVPNPWPATNTQTATVAHNLGYTPAVMAFVDNPAITGIYGAKGLTALPSLFALSGMSFIWSQCRVDDTNVYFDLTNIYSAAANNYDVYSWSFKAYILLETAS